MDIKFSNISLHLLMRPVYCLDFGTVLEFGFICWYLLKQRKRHQFGKDRKDVMVPFCPCRLLNLSPISGLRVCLSRILIKKASSALEEIITFSMYESVTPLYLENEESRRFGCYWAKKKKLCTNKMKKVGILDPIGQKQQQRCTYRMKKALWLLLGNFFFK